MSKSVMNPGRTDNSCFGELPDFLKASQNKYQANPTVRENDVFVRRETGGRKSQEKKPRLLMVSLVSDASPDHVSSLMDPGYEPENDSKKKSFHHLPCETVEGFNKKATHYNTVSN